MRAPDGPPDGSVPHAFVEDLEQPRLDDEDRHHLERVLRIRRGDPVTVSDGRGRWRRARYDDALRPDGEVHVVDDPEPAVGVAFALVKGGRSELVVQKLTELGVDRITPFTAARSVVRWDADRAGRHADRLRRVAREAAMQSRRCRLPTVDGVRSWDDVAALPGAARCDRTGTRGPSLAHPTLLVGPEGGWDPSETPAQVPVVTLGTTVLRAETAAILAGGLLVALRTGLVAPPR